MLSSTSTLAQKFGHVDQLIAEATCFHMQLDPSNTNREQDRIQQVVKASYTFPQGNSYPFPQGNEEVVSV
jgi:hypothetical protein